MRPDGKVSELCFKLPLCFVMGDVEGHDKSVGRYASHSTSRLGRLCDCEKEFADDPDVKCIRTKASDIQALYEGNDKKGMKKIGYHF